MKLIDEKPKTLVDNYMTSPKHLLTTVKKPPASNSTSLSIEPITDKEGLTKAYGRQSKLYTHADTLYIAGTSSIQDIWDDLKIPFKQTDKSMRYRNAVAALKVNPNIMNVVGHSLGGSVALELQKNFPDRKFKSNTYGAPVLSRTAADNRFRNYFDPVSIMDRGATNSVNVGFNPHTFTNFENNKVSNSAFKTFNYRTDE
jgi:hypothetical protein